MQLCFGVEDGSAGDGGDGVREQEPGKEEEGDVFQAPRELDGTPEGGPGEEDVGDPGAAAAIFVFSEGRTGAWPQPEGGGDGEDEPPCSN